MEHTPYTLESVRFAFLDMFPDIFAAHSAASPTTREQDTNQFPTLVSNARRQRTKHYIVDPTDDREGIQTHELFRSFQSVGMRITVELNRFLHPSTSSTPSVRAVSSSYSREIQALWSQHHATEILPGML